MRFNFWGITIIVSPLFFPMLTFMLLVDKTGIALPVAAAIIIHESGHLFAMKLVGQNVLRIELLPSSVLIKGDNSLKNSQDFLVSIAGVCANVLSSLVFMFLGFVINVNFVYYSAANICVAIINLLPVEGLDGGRMIQLVFEEYQRYIELVKKIISVLFLLFSIVTFVCYKINLSIVVFSLYIFLSVLIKV